MFLLDASAAMSDWESLRLAITSCLKSLSSKDYFSLCAVSSQGNFWGLSPEPVTPRTLSNAEAWLRTIKPSGTQTGLLPALEDCLTMLVAGVVGVPILFFITASAVPGERTICASLPSIMKHVRICTLAVGPLCNAHFLRMLAQMTRGFHEVVLASDELTAAVARLFGRLSYPCLVDIQLEIEGVPEFELSPGRAPDLYCGQPLLIHGKFHGTFPPFIWVVGTAAAGEEDASISYEKFEMKVPQESSPPSFSIGRLGARERLDSLSSLIWLFRSDADRMFLQALSAATSMPCPHTALLLYETSLNKKQALPPLELEDLELTIPPSPRASNRPPGDPATPAGAAPAAAPQQELSTSSTQSQLARQSQLAQLGPTSLVLLGTAGGGLFGDLGACQNGQSAWEAMDDLEANGVPGDGPHNHKHNGVHLSLFGGVVEGEVEGLVWNTDWHFMLVGQEQRPKNRASVQPGKIDHDDVGNFGALSTATPAVGGPPSGRAVDNRQEIELDLRQGCRCGIKGSKGGPEYDNGPPCCALL